MHHVGGPQQLTLTSEPPTSGTFCPGPVIFTCMGTEVGGGLSWVVNGTGTLATYTFVVSDMTPFPRNLSITLPLDGVMAAVTSASISIDSNSVDINSVLSVRNVSVLNGASLHCAIIALQSNSIQIEVDNSLSK